MSLSTGRLKLHEAMENLGLRWDETREGWNDPVSQAFEETTVAPLEPQVKAALWAMDRLSQVLHQLKDECG